MLNQVSLIGRFTQDPTVVSTPDGKSKMCAFTLAVDRSFVGKAGRSCDFINCVAWDRRAEIICENFSKGSTIGIEGSLQTRSKEKNGNRRKFTEVVVNNITFCEKKAK